MAEEGRRTMAGGPQGAAVDNGGSPGNGDTARAGSGKDAAAEAWLDFIGRDIENNPERLIAFEEGDLARLEELVEKVVVDIDEALPDDVAF